MESNVFLYFCVGARHVLTEQYLRKFSELMGKPRVRKRRRLAEGFMKGRGAHRRNSWASEMGKGPGEKERAGSGACPRFGSLGPWDPVISFLRDLSA